MSQVILADEISGKIDGRDDAPLILTAEPSDLRGSNPGGLYNGSDGKKYYFKCPMMRSGIGVGNQKSIPDKAYAKDIVFNEYLAYQLYKEAGAPVPEMHLIKFEENGEIYYGIASELIDFEPIPIPVDYSKQELEKFHKDYPAIEALFAVDAWLANWDVVGLGWAQNGVYQFDNIQRSKETGEAIRLDFGGALGFRAQGELKCDMNPKYFDGNQVLDAVTLHTPPAYNPAMYAFSRYKESNATTNKARMQASLQTVFGVSDEKIRELVIKYGPDSKHTKPTKDELAGIIIARKNYLLKKYEFEQTKTMAPLATSFSQASTLLAALPAAPNTQHWLREKFPNTGSELITDDMLNKLEEMLNANPELKAAVLRGVMFFEQRIKNYNRITKKTEDAGAPQLDCIMLKFGTLNLSYSEGAPLFQKMNADEETYQRFRDQMSAAHISMPVDNDPDQKNENALIRRCGTGVEGAYYVKINPTPLLALHLKAQATLIVAPTNAQPTPVIASAEFQSTLTSHDSIEAFSKEIGEQYYRKAALDDPSFEMLYSEFASSVTEPKIERLKHGAMHTGRTAMHIKLFAHLYQKHFGISFNEQEIKLLQIAALFHDAGRKMDDGGDKPEWEAASADAFEAYVQKIKPPFDTALIQKMKDAISGKDHPQEKQLSQENVFRWLLHDADSLEYLRSYHSDYDSQFLFFSKNLKTLSETKQQQAAAELTQLILENKRFLVAMGDSLRTQKFGGQEIKGRLDYQEKAKYEFASDGAYAAMGRLMHEQKQNWPNLANIHQNFELSSTISLVPTKSTPVSATSQVSQPPSSHDNQREQALKVLQDLKKDVLQQYKDEIQAKNKNIGWRYALDIVLRVMTLGAIDLGRLITQGWENYSVKGRPTLVQKKQAIITEALQSVEAAEKALGEKNIDIQKNLEKLEKSLEVLDEQNTSASKLWFFTSRKDQEKGKVAGGTLHKAFSDTIEQIKAAKPNKK